MKNPGFGDRSTAAISIPFGTIADPGVAGVFASGLVSVVEEGVCSYGFLTLTVRGVSTGSSSLRTMGDSEGPSFLELSLCMEGLVLRSPLVRTTEGWRALLLFLR